MSTRREFLKQMGMATAGLAMSGASSAMATPVSSKQRAEAKNEKVKIAYIGIGFRISWSSRKPTWWMLSHCAI